MSTIIHSSLHPPAGIPMIPPLILTRSIIQSARTTTISLLPIRIVAQTCHQRVLERSVGLLRLRLSRRRGHHHRRRTWLRRPSRRKIPVRCRKRSWGCRPHSPLSGSSLLLRLLHRSESFPGDFYRQRIGKRTARHGRGRRRWDHDRLHARTLRGLRRGAIRDVRTRRSCP